MTYINPEKPTGVKFDPPRYVDILEGTRPNRWKIPPAEVDPQEVSEFMRINVDILKKVISDHVDSEIFRYKSEIEKILMHIKSKKIYM